MSIATAKKPAQQQSKGATTTRSKKAPKATAAPEGKNQKLGRLGEDMACHYLENNDITILERNWKCKSGEADIIALEQGTLVFLEVKTRSQKFLGLPEYAVTKEKRDKYERIAISYLSKNPRPSGRVRFDVIAIRITGENQCLLRHHKDAFASDNQ